MENDAANFYYDAAQKAEDPDVRKLLGDLAAIEGKHGDKATFKLSEIESSTAGNEEVKKMKNNLYLFGCNLICRLNGWISFNISSNICYCFCYER